jgi:transcriptional regulator with XRE-family HTH domain
MMVCVEIGALIRQGREAHGLSQDELARKLMEASGSPTLSRNYVSRWENGKRGVSDYWLQYLARVLELPRQRLQEAATKRRAFLALSSVALFGVGAAELLASVAGGDEQVFTRNIVPYNVSMSIGGLALRDGGVKRRLVRWMHDGTTSMLRGNAQGTLFKTQQEDLIELAEISMANDEQTRSRCMRCFTRRAFGLPWPEARAYAAYHATPDDIAVLTTYLGDQADASNRWCAAVYLGQAVDGGSKVARQNLATALRTESSRENLRAIGLALNGELPWKS